MTQPTTECNARCHLEIKDGDDRWARQGSFLDGCSSPPFWEKGFLDARLACLHLMGGWTALKAVLAWPTNLGAILDHKGNDWWDSVASRITLFGNLHKDSYTYIVVHSFRSSLRSHVPLWRSVPMSKAVLISWGNAWAKGLFEVWGSFGWICLMLCMDPSNRIQNLAKSNSLYKPETHISSHKTCIDIQHIHLMVW